MQTLDEQIETFTRLRDAATGAERDRLESVLNELLEDRRRRPAWPDVGSHAPADVPPGGLVWFGRGTGLKPWPLNAEERQCLKKRIAYWTKAGVLKVNKVSTFWTPTPELLATLKPGDTLYWYQTPDETWQALCGRSGFAVVRGEKIVAFCLMMMN